MSKDLRNEHEVDNLLKQVLKNDLPSGTEFRMRQQLAGFRRALETSDDLHAAWSAGSWRCLPVLAQWLTRHRLSWKQALAYVSAAMLATGVVIHLGGYQSVLADSISLLRTSMSISGQIRLASSMDCVIRVQAAGTEATSYHIRWVQDGRTRVDFEAPSAARRILWIIHGNITRSDSAAGLPGQAANPEPVLQASIGALLSPTELARKIDENWQLQPAKKQNTPDRLVFVDRQDRAVIEIRFDRRSNLPVSLNRKSLQVNGTGGSAITAEFSWNQPIAAELMIPRPKSVR
jgi:hypothetical protein